MTNIGPVEEKAFVQNTVTTKRLKITAKDVVAAGAGFGVGVVTFVAGREVFPTVVEKTLNCVKKFLQD